MEQIGIISIVVFVLFYVGFIIVLFRRKTPREKLIDQVIEEIPKEGVKREVLRRRKQIAKKMLNENSGLKE